jgi:phosphoglucosamine mutase
MRHLANTGDGLLTALQIMQEVVRTGKTLQELAASMVRFPQVLINVKNIAKDRLPGNAVIEAAVKSAEDRLGDSGRVLLRASGTEELVRVMVEAASDSLAQEVAQHLADVVKAELPVKTN